MTDTDRSGGSEDPLEKYRQALNQRQSPEMAPAIDPDDPLVSGEAQPATLGGPQSVAEPGEDLPSEEAQRATSGSPQDVAAPDEDLPSDLEDTLSRYQKALDKLKNRQDEVADPLASPMEAQDGPPPGRDRTASRSDDSLARYRQAVSRRESTPQGPGRASARPAADRVVPRETLDRFRKTRNKQPEAPPEQPEVPPEHKAVARPRDGGQMALGAPLDWRIRAVVFTLLLLASPPVQWLVHTRLGAPFAPLDLVAGLSAILPAALILFTARPGSLTGRFVTVIGSVAVASIGSAGFAFGLSLLQNELPEGAGLVLGLLLSLGVFTAVWGPLFLILAPVLARMNRAAQSRA